MAFSTRSCVPALIFPVWLIVRDTVEMFTFARRATSIKLAGFFMGQQTTRREPAAKAGRKQGTIWVDMAGTPSKRLHDPTRCCRRSLEHFSHAFLRKPDQAV